MNMNNWIKTAALSLFAAHAADAAGELLPDLKALQAQDMCLTSSNGNTLLHFSTISWNRGAGPMELVAGKVDKRAKKQKVYQRIYSSDGSYRDSLAGFFVWHQAHNHFHFQDYAHYILQNASGTSARTTIKTTFCIMDSDKIDPEAGGAFYTSCGKYIQGLSVGWGDKYGYELSGQAIDVTGLPLDGEYVLRIAVDPKDRLIESNNSATDNTSEVTIRLDEQGACP